MTWHSLPDTCTLDGCVTEDGQDEEGQEGTSDAADVGVH